MEYRHYHSSGVFTNTPVSSDIIAHIEGLRETNSIMWEEESIRIMLMTHPYLQTRTHFYMYCDGAAWQIIGVICNGPHDDKPINIKRFASIITNDAIWNKCMNYVNNCFNTIHSVEKQCKEKYPQFQTADFGNIGPKTLYISDPLPRSELARRMSIHPKRELYGRMVLRTYSPTLIAAEFSKNENMCVYYDRASKHYGIVSIYGFLEWKFDVPSVLLSEQNKEYKWLLQFLQHPTAFDDFIKYAQIDGEQHDKFHKFINKFYNDAFAIRFL